MERSNFSNTKLLDVIGTGNFSRVSDLIREGVNINQFDIANDNFTPLMLAIDRGYTNIVKILLEAGANLYDSTYFEDTPLGLATTKGNLEIVELLLQSGADPDKGGESPPICNAVGIEHIDIVKTLINWEASVEACTPSGITPLMISAITGNLKIVEILVEEGADVNSIDEDGNVALNKAAYYGHQEIFDYLFPMTFNLKQREYAQQQLARAIQRKKNLTMRLIFAVSRGNINKLQKAIDDGADVNAKDINGNTALSLAREAGNTEIIKLLKDAGAKRGLYTIV